MAPGPVLFRSSDGSVVVLDIPASLGTHPDGRTPMGIAAVQKPYELPEPKSAAAEDIFAEIDGPIAASVRRAVEMLAEESQKRGNGQGPVWCLPRAEMPPDHTAQSYCFDLHAFRDNLLALAKVSAPAPGSLEDIAADGEDLDVQDAWARPLRNASDSWLVASIGGTQFDIPPQSGFLWTQLDDSTDRTLADGRRYDIVLLDPPWPNRSVARGRNRYSMLHQRHLRSLPVARLVAENGVVAVWVTNKAKLHRFVLDKLFPAWGVRLQRRIVWLKITASGQPVYDLASRHRKPYEVLYVGRQGWRGAAQAPVVVAAVPDVYSRKPCLDALYDSLLPPHWTGCELFARGIRPRWFAVGDEVLLDNAAGAGCAENQ
ncbi:MT-A70-domain-containing protein [Dipodascopsis tothii]|uniref:MT-A70-domain-containing protein n=1 Tax=Dipodascopsis tothii TaxID=44089 RepID=UPI0034CE279C